MPSREYFNRPNNMTYHNLCVNVRPPEGIGTTLGLGLKFCIQLERIPSNLDYSFNRFRDNVRKRFKFCDSPGLPPTKDKLYIKSEWVPPRQSIELEEQIDKFITSVNSEYNFLQKNSKKSTNLSILQQNHINFLRANRDFVILAANKNLGPAVMEREEYIKGFLREHLLQMDTYIQLSEKQSLDRIEKMKTDTNKLIINGYKKKELGKHIVKFFTRSFASNVRIPQAYGMPKVHKKKYPVPFRPVVSQCGSVSASISTFLDTMLQPFTKFIPSYIKNSGALLNILDELPQPLPPNARLFTSDATSMYTNIDPDEGIGVVKAYIETFVHELRYKSRFLTETVVQLLEIVMTNNVFQFGDTWWLQKIGTAMGTPCACIYATIFFAYFERTMIGIKYKKNFVLYKRQIDDIFAIWIDDPDNPNAWNDFNKDLNGYCKLDWNTEALSRSVNFLDLTIWLDESNMVKYKTYQKDMNLFLYLPAHSAHPLGVTKSLIFGLLSTYYRQNSSEDDYIRNARLLYNRMINRGHKAEDIRPVFLDAARKIDEKIDRKKLNGQTLQKKETSVGQQLFFHLTYHPRSLPRRRIQENYKKYCNTPDRLGECFSNMTNDDNGGVMKISKMTVAYGQPKNLRDLLSPSRLKEFEDCKVQQFI